MTMTITVNDSIADKVIAFLNTFPKEAVKIEPSRPWYADEVKSRIEEYKSGVMEVTPLHEGMEEIEEYLREINSIAS
ncbi:MAG: hypothetical protein WA099_07745 [Sulfuricurvum sp.]